MNDDLNKEFLELYQEQEKRLSAFAMAITRNREEAKDLVGETILNAYESFEKIENKIAFASYLFSIASRIHKRKIWRKRPFGAWNDSYAENIPSPDAEPGANVDVTVLYQALDKLPDKVKEAVVLFHISGFSIKEICEIQSSSESSIKQRLKRGREKLAEMLSNDTASKNQLKIYKLSSESNSDELEMNHLKLRISNEK